MYKVMYLPEAVCVSHRPNFTRVYENVVFKTREQALRALRKNNVYKVEFVSIGEYNLGFYRKALDWPYKALPKHLFEVVEVN